MTSALTRQRLVLGARRAAAAAAAGTAAVTPRAAASAEPEDAAPSLAVCAKAVSPLLSWPPRSAAATAAAFIAAEEASLPPTEVELRRRDDFGLSATEKRLLSSFHSAQSAVAAGGDHPGGGGGPAAMITSATNAAETVPAGPGDVPADPGGHQAHPCPASLSHRIMPSFVLQCQGWASDDCPSDSEVRVVCIKTSNDRSVHIQVDSEQRCLAFESGSLGGADVLLRLPPAHGSVARHKANLPMSGVKRRSLWWALEHVGDALALSVSMLARDVSLPEHEGGDHDVWRGRRRVEVAVVVTLKRPPRLVVGEHCAPPDAREAMIALLSRLGARGPCLPAGEAVPALREIYETCCMPPTAPSDSGMTIKVGPWGVRCPIQAIAEVRPALDELFRALPYVHACLPRPVSLSTVST